MVQGRSHGDSPFNLSRHFGEKQAASSILPTAVNLPNSPYLHLAPSGAPYYAGRVIYQRPTLSTSSGTATIAYSNDKAHTGKRSLKLDGYQEFAQNRLKLKEGNSYTLQLWVSMANTDVFSYRDANTLAPKDRRGIIVKFYDENGSVISSTQPFEPTGEIVEGWQKIEGNFEVPAGTENISLRLNSGPSGGLVTYFDDIRIQPLKSKMSCYVYNTDDYRLRAVLDDDNFAMIYHYDEAGNLHLVQKETIEGLRTVQESRSYLYENQ
jgi:hypothetical protein